MWKRPSVMEHREDIANDICLLKNYSLIYLGYFQNYFHILFLNQKKLLILYFCCCLIGSNLVSRKREKKEGSRKMETLKYMETTLDEGVLEKVDEIIASYHQDVSQLLQILLEVQKEVKEQYISQKMAYYIAEKLGIKVSQIYDVITFFSALHTTPRAKYPIQVCESIVCKANGRDGLLDHLMQILELPLGEVTYDGRFMLEEVPCFGACDVAPAVRINGKVYGHLDSYDQVLALIKSLV